MAVDPGLVGLLVEADDRPLDRELLGLDPGERDGVAEALIMAAGRSGGTLTVLVERQDLERVDVEDLEVHLLVAQVGHVDRLAGDVGPARLAGLGILMEGDRAPEPDSPGSRPSARRAAPRAPAGLWLAVGSAPVGPSGSGFPLLVPRRIAIRAQTRWAWTVTSGSVGLAGTGAWGSAFAAVATAGASRSCCRSSATGGEEPWPLRPRRRGLRSGAGSGPTSTMARGRVRLEHGDELVVGGHGPARRVQVDVLERPQLLDLIRTRSRGAGLAAGSAAVVWIGSGGGGGSRRGAGGDRCAAFGLSQTMISFSRVEGGLGGVDELGVAGQGDLLPRQSRRGRPSRPA